MPKPTPEQSPGRGLRGALLDMENNVCRTRSLIGALLVMAERGSTHGLETDECEAMARVCDCAIESMDLVKDAWTRAEERSRPST